LPPLVVWLLTVRIRARVRSWEMSTLLTHRRAIATATTNAKAHEACITAAEAATQQVAEMARVAVVVAEATAAAAMALREEDDDDQDGARPRGPHKRCSVSPSLVLRRGRCHCRGSQPIV
jgi:hypothetical protein